MPDLNSKHAQQHLKGHWILEMGELAALNRAELTTVRSWMSRSEGVYRPAYGRQLVYLPRQCVFIATSNEGEPLKDTTGNRRFWPVDVGLIDTHMPCRPTRISFGPRHSSSIVPAHPGTSPMKPSCWQRKPSRPRVSISRSGRTWSRCTATTPPAS
jgi:Virulence-associated protein E